ncbi:Pentatricopeptide repeat-containing protein [Apostasia shenzhenica]|uniref:Pentatricopeptide repeat-containing protein n=1 Tax=Apostasia shenzhenica TaxID=1088818 RepID=A0A2I0AKP3_9ASPA|nr:Pentatricopeptide repeat-containing protein [Apostasia shenzhenica]
MKGTFFAVVLRRRLTGNLGPAILLPVRFPPMNGSRNVSCSPETRNKGMGFAVEGEEASSSPSAVPDDLRSRIFRLRLPKRSATAVLENWVAEGRNATAPVLRQIAKDLKKSKRYKHALEISEWMKSHQESELSDSDYAMRIDLITKVFGVSSAEEFFEGLPAFSKSCEVYTALLHSYAGAKLIDKAESLFQRIMDSNFSSSILIYNEMMTLYASIGQMDKVHNIVEELKRRNVSLDLFAYNLWITASAATLDIERVSSILYEMACDSCSDGGWETYMKLADIYITTGHLAGSDNALVNSGETISQKEWITYDFLIILHAGLGNIQKINEIWKALKRTSQKMTSRNFICILSSYLVLGKLKEAGEIICEWKQSKVLDFDISSCDKLFNALVKAGLMDAAEKFHGLMLQNDCKIGESVMNL